MDWRLRDLLGRFRPTQQSAPPEPDVEPDGGVTTKLYTCSDCERTYISEGMDSCSECGAMVTQVPSEADLGFGSLDR